MSKEYPPTSTTTTTTSSQQQQQQQSPAPITFTCLVHYDNRMDLLTFNNVSNFNDLIPTIRQTVQLSVPQQQPIILYNSDPNNNKVQPLDPRAHISGPPQDIYTMAKIAKNNYQSRGSSIQQNHIFTLIAGGSGIGKTRAGEEVAHIPGDIINRILTNSEMIDKKEFFDSIVNCLYIYINLNHHGNAYFHLLDKKHTASIRIGYRLAYSSGIYGNLNFESFNNMNQQSKDYFNFDIVLNNIKKEQMANIKPKAIIIHLDEYQLYIDAIKYNNLASEINPREDFKSLLKFGMTNIYLEPIPPSLSGPIVEYHLERKLLKESDSFNIAIGDTGFIPKDMILLMNEANMYDENYSTNAFRRIISALDNSILSTNKNLLKTICALAITQTPVGLSEVLTENPKVTLDDARREGFIYLRETKDRHKFLVYISFYLLKGFNTQLPQPWFPDHLMIPPTDNNKWLWKYFEMLYPYFQICLISTLISLKKPLYFSSVFRGAQGTESLPEDPIVFYPENISKEVETNISSNLVSSSTFGPLDFTTIKTILICTINTAKFDHRFALKTNKTTYMVYVQIKHSNNVNTLGT
eukprot:gene8368-10278_t